MKHVKIIQYLNTNQLGYRAILKMIRRFLRPGQCNLQNTINSLYEFRKNLLAICIMIPDRIKCLNVKSLKIEYEIC